MLGTGVALVGPTGLDVPALARCSKALRLPARTFDPDDVAAARSEGRHLPPGLTPSVRERGLSLEPNPAHPTLPGLAVT